MPLIRFIWVVCQSKKYIGVREESKQNMNAHRLCSFLATIRFSTNSIIASHSLLKSLLLCTIKYLCNLPGNTQTVFILHMF